MSAINEEMLIVGRRIAKKRAKLDLTQAQIELLSIKSARIAASYERDKEQLRYLQELQ